MAEAVTAVKATQSNQLLLFRLMGNYYIKVNSQALPAACI